jgi:uncharacterized membrane protein
VAVDRQSAAVPRPGTGSHRGRLLLCLELADLPGLAKLGIVACCGVVLRKGLESAIGKAAQIGASVLVGVFLAIFGQVYQTGADSWLLFAARAGLILP